MKSLTYEQKRELLCKVKLNYCYMFTSEAKATLQQVKELLEKYNLAVSLEEGTYYGPCYNLCCSGCIDLSTAEYIAHNLYLMQVAGSVGYSHGDFTLTAGSLD